MQPLIIEKTISTPGVVFDKSKGILAISGRSLPEDAKNFYLPLIEWFQAYLADPNPSTEVVFEMEYINTASSKMIYELIRLLNEPAKRGDNVKVLWKYIEDDDDTLEAGQEYASLVNVPFVFSVLMA